LGALSSSFFVRGPTRDFQPYWLELAERMISQRTSERRFEMKRKAFDVLASVGGLIVAAALVVAGALLLWGYNFANNDVHNQLAMQDITFPTLTQLQHPNGTEITKGMYTYLSPYAGKQLLTGPEAQAYADHFIAVHLSEMPYHGVYSKISAASMANPKNTMLSTFVQLSFRGTTLRGLLLEAYGFSVFAEIALWAAIASFCLAFFMFVLVGFGLWHSRRTSPSVELLSSATLKAA
jgi:uncharacterized membrane protein